MKFLEKQNTRETESRPEFAGLKECTEEGGGCVWGERVLKPMTATYLHSLSNTAQLYSESAQMHDIKVEAMRGVGTDQTKPDVEAIGAFVHLHCVLQGC